MMDLYINMETGEEFRVDPELTFHDKIPEGFVNWKDVGMSDLWRALKE